ncbi:hypothetical protein WN51_11270 [Melipona quadrifasciata]|uniref:Uncharacterized protein n=1 Tax=Melipona quadrifasciata TaxID=166423 RepID=A0A0N0U6F5_9HYME|nr:hypothetical protein WN51_11270 [Melipona quadrifasciata]
MKMIALRKVIRQRDEAPRVHSNDTLSLSAGLLILKQPVLRELGLPHFIAEKIGSLQSLWCNCCDIIVTALEFDRMESDSYWFTILIDKYRERVNFKAIIFAIDHHSERPFGKNDSEPNDYGFGSIDALVNFEKNHRFLSLTSLAAFQLSTKIPQTVESSEKLLRISTPELICPNKRTTTHSQRGMTKMWKRGNRNSWIIETWVILRDRLGYYKKILELKHSKIYPTLNFTSPNVKLKN